MVGVGLISYSLYLWHWPLLALYRATSIGEGSAWVRLELCCVAVLLAIASYRYIEQPFRKLRFATGRTVIIGAAGSVVLSLAAYAVGYRASQPAALEDDVVLAIVAEGDVARDFGRCHYPVTIDLKRFPLPDCESIPGVPAEVAVWGDSFAVSWRSLGWMIAERQQQSAIVYSFDACPPFVGYLHPAKRPGNYKCRKFNALVAAKLKGMDTVVVAVHWQEWLTSFEAEQGLAESLASIAPSVRRIILIGPTPDLKEALPKCLRASAVDRCAQARAEFEAMAAPIRATLGKLAAPYSNVAIIELGDYLCTDQVCPGSKDGIMLYRDWTHLTDTATTAFSLKYLADPSAGP